MAKTRFRKITCTATHATHYAVAIADVNKVSEYRTKVLRSIVDFVDPTVNEFTVNITVEPTEEKPEEGTDLVLKPVKPVIKHEADGAVSITIVDLDDDK